MVSYGMVVWVGGVVVCFVVGNSFRGFLENTRYRIVLEVCG